MEERKKDYNNIGNVTKKYPISSDGSVSDDPDVDSDDDDMEEDNGGGTTTETDPEPADRRRDEVGEVRKLSSKDTNRLRLWRIVVTGVLLLTALAVTLTTYTLLEQQEEENFHTAVRSLYQE
jgi:hypothetical protein